MADIVTKKRNRMISASINATVVLSMNEETVPSVTAAVFYRISLDARHAEVYTDLTPAADGVKVVVPEVVLKDVAVEVDLYVQDLEDDKAEA